MILSLFRLVIFTVVATIFFELVAKHLVAFFNLSLPSRAAFTLIVSPFFTGGFPAFELPSHIFDVVTYYILSRSSIDRKSVKTAYSKLHSIHTSFQRRSN
jgi:hypothetical protein